MYDNHGDIMKIYLDLVFIVNFLVDFILLFSVKQILKKVTSLKRLLLGSITGSLSLIFIFLNLNSLELFLYKIIISILIILITFGPKDFKRNITYFYILSIILGGTLYLLDITITYKNTNLIYIKNSYFLNFLLIIIVSPIIIYLYVKEHKNYKLTITNKYQVEIEINKEKHILEAILDTGNTLIDPYKKRPIILIDKEINYKRKHPIYVPYKALNTTGVIKCILPDKVLINNIEFKNCLIGLSTDKFSLNGATCILPNNFKEDLC